MEFFFPADVFAYPGPSRRRTPSYGADPSANIFGGCGFDSHPLFADSLAHAIQREQAAQAAVRARAQAQRAAAARRAAEEQRQAQTYLQHVLEMQQREAQRRYHLEQLRRQQQEAQRRQQYEEYQRRKAYAIAKERQRIAAQKAAEEQGRQLFLALEDLLFGGLNGFYCSPQHDDDDEDEEDIELAHKNDVDDNKQTSAIPAATAQAPIQNADTKGKAKATEEEVEQSMDVDNDDHDHEDTAAAAAAALMATDEDPAEVGPAPASDKPQTDATAAPVTKTEQLVFSHSFPSDSSFDKTSVRADQINVSVDEVKRTVTVSGLWNNDQPTPSTPARAASPTPSDSSSRRGRSRSPKRARVSDVDENGEEIVSPDANEDDFVEVSFTPAGAAKEDKVSKAFDLPAGADIEDLRAELSEEGLKLFTTVSA